ncbi:MAG: type II toxin-antitoxin system PemK/MazF family toxin [Fimbriimonas ginsengisoli]|uniref:mRNA interferase n=1 Tax=Fimbriimonas ginsengisoli TaxID=1005039 RepID=A0A931PV60_FIMGI|nr:type II toxin-antitoxin system PemK/MazF family toxin [Fimbriimonas ginsengisoli]MBI3743489.1 type II toxin-antitoxin system PemK/MazF family toxin [Chloroflexota bacterium]
MPEQGEVYDYDFGPQRDSRQEGPRPAVIVQTDLLNQVAGYGLTILVPVSTKGRNSPSHVRLEPSVENGLAAVSYAKCEQIFTVPIGGLSSRRGRLSRDQIFAVKQALRAVLAL